jgi:hypothetical protein
MRVVEEWRRRRRRRRRSLCRKELVDVDWWCEAMV